MVSNVTVVVNDEFGKMRKEALVAKFETLFRNFLGGLRKV
jgi:hypothetical protein